MPRFRIALLLATTALVASSSLAGAAPGPKPQVTDAKGDAIGLGPGFDIVSAGLSTTGTTKKVGKKSVYTPKRLVATVTFAGPPTTQPGAVVDFTIDTSACQGGYFSYSYRPGSLVLNEGTLFVSGCGEADPLGPSTFYDEAGPVVKGNSITWSLRLSAIGSDLPLGSSFRNFRVSTDVAEPATYIVGTTLVGPHIDTAASKAFWDLG